MLAVFAYGLIRIDTDARYERPAWREVAQSLGAARTPRAIVLYDGGLATDPLAVYLHGVPWTEPAGPVSVGEVDVIGYPWQSMPAVLPANVRLIGTRTVNGYLVARFSIAGGWRLTRGQIGLRGGQLLGPGSPSPAVLVQSARPAR
jgi:hypothetical protein